MTDEQKKVSAKEILADIRAGMDDESLKEKYSLTDRKLRKVMEKLVSAGHLTEEDLEVRRAAGGISVGTPPPADLPPQTDQEPAMQPSRATSGAGMSTGFRMAMWTLIIVLVVVALLGLGAFTTAYLMADRTQAKIRQAAENTLAQRGIEFSAKDAGTTFSMAAVTYKFSDVSFRDKKDGYTLTADGMTVDVAMSDLFASLIKGSLTTAVERGVTFTGAALTREKDFPRITAETVIMRRRLTRENPEQMLPAVSPEVSQEIDLHAKNMTVDVQEIFGKTDADPEKLKRASFIESAGMHMTIEAATRTIAFRITQFSAPAATLEGNGKVTFEEGAKPPLGPATVNKDVKASYSPGDIVWRSKEDNEPYSFDKLRVVFNGRARTGPDGKWDKTLPVGTGEFNLREFMTELPESTASAENVERSVTRAAEVSATYSYKDGNLDTKAEVKDFSIKDLPDGTSLKTDLTTISYSGPADADLILRLEKADKEGLLMPIGTLKAGVEGFDFKLVKTESGWNAENPAVLSAGSAKATYEYKDDRLTANVAVTDGRIVNPTDGLLFKSGELGLTCKAPVNREFLKEIAARNVKRVLPRADITLGVKSLDISLPENEHDLQVSANRVGASEGTLSYKYDNENLEMKMEFKDLISGRTDGGLSSTTDLVLMRYTGTVKPETAQNPSTLFEQGPQKLVATSKNTRYEWPTVVELLKVTPEDRKRLFAGGDAAWSMEYAPENRELTVTGKAEAPLSTGTLDAKMTFGPDIMENPKPKPRALDLRSKMTMTPEGVEVGDPSRFGRYGFTRVEVDVRASMEFNEMGIPVPQSMDADGTVLLEGFTVAFDGDLKRKLELSPLGQMGIIEQDRISVNKFQLMADVNQEVVRVHDSLIRTPFADGDLRAVIDLNFLGESRPSVRTSRLSLTNMNPTLKTWVAGFASMLQIPVQIEEEALIFEWRGTIPKTPGMKIMPFL